MTSKLLRFGSFRLDLERFCIHGPAGQVDLRRKSFDVLRYLLEHGGQVASKEELLSALWPDVTVTDDSLTQCIREIRRAIGDDRRQIIKTVPRRGYLADVPAPASKVAPPTPSLDTEGPGTMEEALRALPLPNKPSIAVLPFTNMTGEPEQDYFADGIVEDIISALSRLNWLFVIARNSSFIYKNQAVDVKHVGRDLGVRYVLEGSVRKAANRVRITGQLINAITSTHLWADRFDGDLKDIFDLQDRVTASVVGAIAPKLEQTEIERATRKPTENLDAYDYYLRGLANLHRRNTDALDEARRQFHRAIELDGDFASAHAMAAFCYVWRKRDGLMADRTKETAECEHLARRATHLGRDDAVSLCWGGYALAFVAGDVEAGSDLIAKGLTFNPNLAAGWMFSGWVQTYIGEPDLGIEHLKHAMRLSPVDPFAQTTYAAVAFAHLLARRFDEACTWAGKSLREDPNHSAALRTAAASHALAGRLDEAHRAVARMRQINPEVRLSHLRELAPLRRPEHLATWVEGLSKAGLPD